MTPRELHYCHLVALFYNEPLKCCYYSFDLPSTSVCVCVFVFDHSCLSVSRESKDRKEKRVRLVLQDYLEFLEDKD